jgi:predicted component of type VI protein secretion system
MKCTQVYADTYYMIGGNMYPKALHGKYSYTQETMQLDLMKEVSAPKPKKEGQQ